MSNSTRAVPVPAPTNNSESDGFNLKMLIGYVKDFGVVGVLIWYLWYSTTVTIPQVQVEFNKIVRDDRETFLKELKDQRAHDEKRNNDLLMAIRDLTREIAAKK